MAVYSGIDEDDYELLSEIAPTLAGPVGTENYLEPWQDMTRLIGSALGQAERAEEIVAGIEEQYARSADAHPEFAGAKVVFGAGYIDGNAAAINVRTSGDSRSQAITDLGLTVPAEIDQMADPGSFTFDLSPELWGETFDLVDVVVLLADPEVRAAIEASPIFDGSRVAAEGRIVWLDTDAMSVALSFTSPTSLPAFLDALVPQLVAALDGDPATEVPPSPDL